MQGPTAYRQPQPAVDRAIDQRYGRSLVDETVQQKENKKQTWSGDIPELVWKTPGEDLHALLFKKCQQESCKGMLCRVRAKVYRGYLLGKYPTEPRVFGTEIHHSGRYELDSGTQNFGKFGMNSIPVPRVPVYLRPQYREYD